MTPGARRGPIVIDTDVFSADVLPGERTRLAERYAPIVTGRPAFIRNVRRSRRLRDPIVIGTNVYGSDLVPGSCLGVRCRSETDVRRRGGCCT